MTSRFWRRVRVLMGFYILITIPFLGFAWFSNEVIASTISFTYTEVLVISAICVFGYFFVMTVLTNAVNDRVFGNDERYQRWRAEGNDTIIDILSEPPPNEARPCPNCGAKMPRSWAGACPHCGYIRG